VKRWTLGGAQKKTAPPKKKLKMCHVDTPNGNQNSIFSTSKKKEPKICLGATRRNFQTQLKIQKKKMIVTPNLAIRKFSQKNYVSHVKSGMEPNICMGATSWNLLARNFLSPIILAVNLPTFAFTSTFFTFNYYKIIIFSFFSFSRYVITKTPNIYTHFLWVFTLQYFYKVHWRIFSV
jgi:hypothetical protein